MQNLEYDNFNVNFNIPEASEMIAVTSSPKSAELTGTIGKNNTHINTQAVTNNNTIINTLNPNTV